jgi:hypothetical protein
MLRLEPLGSRIRNCPDWLVEYSHRPQDKTLGRFRRALMESSHSFGYDNMPGEGYVSSTQMWLQHLQPNYINIGNIIWARLRS